jgi:hypothetical protein
MKADAMTERQAFNTARRELLAAHERKTSLCAPFLAALPVHGAAVSVLAGSAGQSTVCSSDDTATRLDELQFDLGEGPCWDAMNTLVPVLRPRLATDHDHEWPLFTSAVREDALASAVGSVFAFPLFVGSLGIGAVDLYSTTTRPLDESDVSDATELASIASWQVLRSILTDEVLDDLEGPATHNRREVHQATGMVLAQLDISADEAALLLRAHAFASGRTVAEIAHDVIERRLDFAADGPA